jgi:hypothetical protein
MILRATGLAAALVLGFGFASGMAAAQQPTDAQKAAIRSACPTDFQSHCAGVSPGGAAALQCLEKNVASLSSGCQTAVKAVMPGGTTDPTPASTTQSDDGSGSTDSSGGTKSQPAAQPAAKTATQSSSQPEVAMPPVHLTLRQEVMLVRQSCGPDFRAYCSSVPLGGGNAVACLHRHRAQLSGNCKEALAAVLLQ